jgi:hypothetical protein
MMDRARIGDDRLTRRAALRLLGLGGGALLLAACGAGTRPGAPQPTAPAAIAAGADYEAHFARDQPVDEPNGDLAKVVWPEFVTRAGPEVQRLYEFQVVNGALMRYMPRFCGCGGDGHRNNRDCYVKSVNADGSVVFDAMAPT